ncbi:MAG: hypothetical protein HUJ98_12595, partial [Bacteroidaceae bacterium]|nr:hypothetical protein [Bacteroidaceae bacterium]
MNKVLIVASVPSFIDWFCQDHIDYFINKGAEVHVAVNTLNLDDTDAVRTLEFYEKLKKKGLTLHNIDISRSPFSKSIYRAY